MFGLLFQNAFIHLPLNIIASMSSIEVLLWVLLTYLIQRFKQNNGLASKIDTKVSFPLKLEMFPYTNRARNSNADAKDRTELARSCTYDLQSVVVHVGNLETGKQHAFSICIKLYSHNRPLRLVLEGRESVV